MRVTLRKRKNDDGTTSQFLAIWQPGENGKPGKYRYEFLHELKLSKGTNPIDRQKNKENLELAQRIAAKRAHQVAADKYSVESEIGKKADVLKWMQHYVDKYKKKDKRNMQGALNRFKAFLQEQEINGLSFGTIDEVLIEGFRDDLKSKSKGEGAASYFARFKKMMKAAYRDKVLNLQQKNPAADISAPKGRARRKDVLIMDEIRLLNDTPTESVEVKRASLLALMCGLRWADIKVLKWENVKGNKLQLPQSKTDEPVYINLNERAIKILGKHGKPDDFVFNLPSANGANKSIKAWVRRAGIQKKITFHNLRHSFGTNLVFNGADITTTASLMGHTSIKHTQRYIKTANELKERATDTLNF